MAGLAGGQWPGTCQKSARRIHGLRKSLSGGQRASRRSSKKQAEFEAKEKNLSLEDNIAAIVANKRDELLGPILEKLEKAINEVGKEGGYTHDFRHQYLQRPAVCRRRWRCGAAGED
ncbi:MAG: OmpH family outer membrane protein [Saprospiraceae bacterium]|nr:OmpH family outer membrane protein [Saprospiraceae bacterium]